MQFQGAHYLEAFGKLVVASNDRGVSLYSGGCP
jgi:hypothetical protein